MSRVVWILGAGFSKSLGGPLLPSLLSSRSAERIQAVYGRTPGLTEGREVDIIRAILEKDGWEQKDRPPAWVDAEEFLEQLDNAAFGTTGRAAVQGLLRSRAQSASRPIPSPDFFESMAAAAKRLVAAECCMFLRNVDPNSERWRPYVNWARSLEAEDTIITFNYDRVVEIAAATAGRKIDVVAGGQPVRDGLPRLLKMHGSVDWRRAGKEYLLVQDHEHAVKCEAEEIGIASPGPSKLTLSEQWIGLWRAAEKAIREAQAIAFVGYRFPPTDSYSRERLLGAVGQNTAGPHVSVHTVLGPETYGDQARRLEGMLKYALGQTRRTKFAGGRLPTQSPPNYYTLLAQPLYAEDFLSLVHRQAVIDPFVFVP